MSPRIRQLTAVFVCLASVISLGVILLYSAGYSMNWETGQFSRTGGIRLSIITSTDPLTILLPVGQTSYKTNPSFTHLLPTTYHLYIEADQYLPYQHSVTVTENATAIIDPLQLWPTNGVVRIALDPAQVHQTAPTINNLSIKGQQALASLTQIKITNALALSNDSALVIGRYELLMLEFDTLNSTTLVRLSQPILAATLMEDAPYVFYVIGNELHALDTRSTTGYYDQIIAAVPNDINYLYHDTDADRIILTDQSDHAYSYSLTVAK